MKKWSGFRWFEFAEGVLLVLLGIFTLARPASALTGFIVAYGAVAVIMGVADILLYVRIAHFTGFGPIVSLLSGTLSVMAGVMLLVYPNAGKLILSVLVPLWFLAHCISRLSNLNKIRFFAGEFPYYFTLILNVLGLVLGGLMILNPWISLLSVPLVIGIYLLLLGVDCLILAFSKLIPYDKEECNEHPYCALLQYDKPQALF